MKSKKKKKEREGEIEREEEIEKRKGVGVFNRGVFQMSFLLQIILDVLMKKTKRLLCQVRNIFAIYILYKIQ